MNLDELLNGINDGAMFYSSLDNDAILVSLAAGGDIPFTAAWDKTGYRTYEMNDEDDYQPINRTTFIELVKTREPLI